MKNVLGAALLATLSPAFLSAESYATVIKIKPNYQTKTISEPQRRCQKVKVPIYGIAQTRGASSSDVLGGMISEVFWVEPFLEKTGALQPAPRSGG